MDGQSASSSAMPEQQFPAGPSGATRQAEITVELTDPVLRAAAWRRCWRGLAPAVIAAVGLLAVFVLGVVVRLRQGAAGRGLAEALRDTRGSLLLAGVFLLLAALAALSAIRSLRKARKLGAADRRIVYRFHEYGVEWTSEGVGVAVAWSKFCKLECMGTFWMLMLDRRRGCMLPIESLDEGVRELILRKVHEHRVPAYRYAWGFWSKRIPPDISPIQPGRPRPPDALGV